MADISNTWSLENTPITSFVLDSEDKASYINSCGLTFNCNYSGVEVYLSR